MDNQVWSPPTSVAVESHTVLRWIEPWMDCPRLVAKMRLHPAGHTGNTGTWNRHPWCWHRRRGEGPIPFSPRVVRGLLPLAQISRAPVVAAGGRTPITSHFRYCSARGAKRHLTYLGVTATLHSSSYTFVSISLPLHPLLQSISLIISLPRQRSQEAHQISYHGPENPCTACQVDNCADTAAQFAAQFPNTGCLSPT